MVEVFIQWGLLNGGDAGIDADEGITVNGGEVIALGSDMLEKPLSTSTQNFVCFSLNSVVETDSQLNLKNENNEVIASFVANEDFKTLIISNGKIGEGKYYLYKGEEKIAEIENN